jgi:hypothetical protein
VTRHHEGQKGCTVELICYHDEDNKTLLHAVELGHIHCVLDSWARLTLHVEPLRKQSEQEFTEKNKSVKWLFKTNAFGWDF